MDLAPVQFDLTQAGAILADMVAAYLDAAPPPSAVLASSRTLRAGSRRCRGAASGTTLALGALPCCSDAGESGF
jgi:hypothetical protein